MVGAPVLAWYYGTPSAGTSRDYKVGGYDQTTARPKDPETTTTTENYNPSSTREGEEEKEEIELPERTATEVEMAALPSPPRIVASPLLLVSSPDASPPPSRPSRTSSPLKPIRAVSSRCHRRSHHQQLRLGQVDSLMLLRSW
jgi:hypothetical protein